jgi:uncharacterized protein YbbC (DUF1343 family)
MILYRTSILLVLLTISSLGAASITGEAANPQSSGPLVKVQSRPLGSGPTLSGLDVLKRENFKRLKGKKLALLTNTSAIDREGNHILDLMLGQPDLNIVSLFSPEHGLYGDLDVKVSDFQDTATGLMVHSLYSNNKDPETPPHYPKLKNLKGLDAVVVDLQDIGARYYTYISYMGYMMEFCAKAGVEVIVLDRPNPIGGHYVDGPQQDPDTVGKVTSYFPMPIAHGMTMGELAKMFNAEKKILCKLTIVQTENWTRDMYLDQTGLRWVNPSPNIQDLEAALVYPGIGITEKLVSMGRGTSEPFHIFGSPIIEDSQDLIDAVMKTGIKGVELQPVEFTPTGTLAKGHHGEKKLCRGARMKITDRSSFRAYALGLAVMDYLHAKYGTGVSPKYKVFQVRGPASAWVCSRIVERAPVADTLKIVAQQVDGFLPIREKYLIYPSNESE